VKAFNTIPFATMSTAEPAGTRRVLFVAGDDAAATSTVANLIRDVGLHPIVLGPLASAGRQMELGGIFSGLELFTPAKEEVAS
jgi:predicted dinucleotide-binding enzyme